ncbi:D-aspartate oxidase-like [Planococcus citri]|uniref:D-aspartate oxidase-like n=1 Tax=Planococcus citri TaxID=170843 RepID=UPI0031F98013
MRNLEIAVLGAGVVGVNTALRIQEEFPSAKVTLIHDKFYGTALSYGPPGIFYPSSDFGGFDRDLAKNIVRTSFKYYQQLLNIPKSGVTEIRGYLFSDTNESNVRSDLMESIVPCYRPTTEEERQLNSKSWKYGSYFETIRTQCTLFIPWALKKFKQNGGVTLKKHITNFSELETEYDVVFNCTGLNAKYLCNDPFIVPIRGQLMHVYAPQIKNFYFNDSNTYIFPLGNGKVCMGGSRDYGSYETEVNHFDTLSIIKRCSEIVPSLKEPTILTQWVGLRPHRNIVRLEVENLGKLKIVHNYGHGGSGITTAPGSADHVVDLFKHSHSSKSKL